jgi:hypothetical protein
LPTALPSKSDIRSITSGKPMIATPIAARIAKRLASPRGRQAVPIAPSPPTPGRDRHFRRSLILRPEHRHRLLACGRIAIALAPGRNERLPPPDF